MELLLGPGEGVDPGEEVYGVLGAWGQGAPGLFDQFEEDRGDTDLFREVGLGEAGDLPGVVKGMRVFRECSCRLYLFHLTRLRVSTILSITMTMQVNSNPKTRTENSGEWRDQQYMTREQVADLFQISTRTVSELTARGVIIAVKLGGGRNAPVRYRRETLEETAKKLERR